MSHYNGQKWCQQSQQQPTCGVEALDTHLHEVEGDGPHQPHAHDPPCAAVHTERAHGRSGYVAELVEDAPLI